MTDRPDDADRVWEWIDALCGDGASAEQVRDLEQRLRDDPQACDLYNDYCQLHSALIFRAKNQESFTAFRAAFPPAPPPPTLNVLGVALHGSVGYFSQTGPLSYLIATFIMLLLGVVAWSWKLPNASQLAWQSLPPTVEHRPKPEPKTDSVGRITGMVDCRWQTKGLGIRDWGLEKQAGKNGAQSLKSNPQSLVFLGDRFALASGLLEITYKTGGKVILQGPVWYEVESRSGGYLSVGKLTAKLEKRGEESPNLQISKSPNSSLSTLHSPLFTIKTPTAVITDLGTEFGVEVSREGRTTSHVFRGTVQLQPVAGAESQRNAVVLHAHQSARVEGRGTDRITMLTATAAPIDFVRQIPQRSLKSFDLVDLVAGGDGFSGRRNRGIDPITGRIGNRAPGTYLPALAGDRQYHRVEGMACIDGVFIPDGGAGPVQVDSAGHAFDGFDKTDNLTYGHIWAGGPIALANSVRAIRTDLRGGDDYVSPGHGLLLVHANSGITFDLDAVRRATGGRILRFCTVGGNTASFSDIETVLADLWVLVDGRPRFVRQKTAGRGGPAIVTVPLKESDRFLTLAFTDGGDGCGWDWTIFGDPRLELIVTEPNQTPDSPAN